MSINYPLVKVKTKDNLTLHGLLTEPEKSSKTIAIHIHGTSGNFYWNNYFELLTKSIVNLNIAHLSTDNRGSEVYQLQEWQAYTGASLEKFEDCILNIDAWIELALNKWYENIILEGHSYGTEKIVYYMNKGKYVEKIKWIILLWFSDTVGSQIKYEKSIWRNYRQEAEDLKAKEESWKLLKDYFALCWEMPISAQTYLHWFTEDSEGALALPFHKRKELPFFQNIKVSILWVISDKW